MRMRLFNLFYSFIYSLTLFVMTGVPDLASAAVSCSDTIPGSEYRYLDTLSKFYAFNGKTYAISRSALTGATTLPDGFFNFDSFITYEYKRLGDPAGSLKQRLADGEYGAARPVRISSPEVNDFILKRYGSYLSNVNTSATTYVDVWKDFGVASSTPFTHFDGTSIEYHNWLTTPSYDDLGTEPLAVMMGADGKWVYGLTGARTSQIVEFPEVLDCAVDMTVPTDPPVVPGDPPPVVTGLWCGQDLDGDEDMDSADETAQCLQTSEGSFCPVGAVNCTGTYVPPICPPGMTLNPERDTCQADPIVYCPASYVFDRDLDMCVKEVSCPDGGLYNPVTNRCEIQVANECPTPDYSYDAATDKCTKPVDCFGGTFNTAKDRCELTPQYDCPPLFAYSSTSGKCEQLPVCESGQSYNTERDRCESAISGCAVGYSYNPLLNTCVADVICPDGGVLSGTSDKCEIVATETCFDGWTYSAERMKCEKAPDCAAPGIFDTVSDLCIAAVSGTLCSDGYTYSIDHEKCIQAPICLGGSYDATDDRCEAPPSYTCSAAGYAYNVSTGRCEAVPSCPTGTVYDFARNRCEASVGSCPAGYVYSPVLDRCVADVACPDGGSLNGATDKCEIVAGVSCPDATWVYNPAAAKCEKPPSCLAPGAYDVTYNQCMTNSTGTVCPSGYTFNSTLGKCIQSPICTNSTYNSTTDKCEVTPNYTCSLPGFVYNTSRARCEANPSCPVGTAYNTTRDRCEAALSSCPAGYSYNDVLDRCVADATCSSGGVLSGTTDKCELSAATTCLAGWTYNPSTLKCEQPPTCLTPGSYDASSNLCLTVYTGTTCPVGYTYNSTLAACIQVPLCSGGTYNATTNRCEVSPSYTCPDSTYSYNASTARCEKTPTCAYGTYSATYNQCLLAFTPGCPVGYTYNATRARCEKSPPTCPVGYTYNTTTNNCRKTYTATTTYYCPSGGTLSGTTCSYPATLTGAVLYNIPIYRASNYSGANHYTHNTNGIYILSGYATATSGAGRDIIYRQSSSTADVIVSSSSTLLTKVLVGYISLTNPGGWVQLNKTPVLIQTPGSVGTVLAGYIPTTAGTYGGTYTCPSGGTLSGTTCSYTASVQSYTCPSGGTLSGTTCTLVAAATCSNGTLDGTLDVCQAAYTPQCAVGTTYSSTLGQCVSAAICTNGLLDGTTDRCYQTANAGCGTGYTLSGSICYATATCGVGGTLNTTTDYCTASAAYTCPAGYTYSSTSGKCYVNPTCSSGGLDPTLDVCQVANTFTCPVGYTLNGTTCQQAPTCAVGGTYSVTIDRCDAGNSVCVAGLSLDAANDVCQVAAGCGSGLLDGVNNVCYATATSACNVGFLLSGSICQANPTCSTGGIFEAPIDYCASTPTYTCPAGYAYSAVTGKCYVAPNCSGGGLDTTSDVCQIAFAQTCPDDYSLNGSICQLAPTCAGGAYSTLLDKCDGGTNVCASPTVLDVQVDKCYAAAECGAGSLDLAADVCQSSAAANCGSGYILSDSLCVGVPICSPGGVYDQAADYCTSAPDYTCPGGYTYGLASGLCFAAPSCLGGGLSPEFDVCQSASSLSCPTGYNLSGPVCQILPTCSEGGTYDSALDRCNGGSGVCPSPSLLDGENDICFQSSTCAAGGALDTSLDKCVTEGTVNCSDPSGGNFVFEEESALCVSPPVCASGTYVTGSQTCEAVVTKNCGSYTWLTDEAVCAEAVVCPSDPAFSLRETIKLSSLIDMCVSDADHSCPGVVYTCPNGGELSGTVCLRTDSIAATPGLEPYCNTWTSTLGATGVDAMYGVYIPDYSFWYGGVTCYGTPEYPFVCAHLTVEPGDATTCYTAPLRPILTCPDGYMLQGDVCTMVTTYSATPLSGSYTGLPIMKCEAVPYCDGGDPYMPEQDACFAGDTTCPLGDHACSLISGSMQCSANPCGDPEAAVGTVDFEEFDAEDMEMMQDDAARDESGNCQGQVYIFAGASGRCRPPGLKVGYANDCCEGKDTVSEDTAGNIYSAYSAINTLYEMGQVVYAAVQYASQTVSGVMAAYEAMETSLVVAEGIHAAMTAIELGATIGTAIYEGLAAYAAALMNPTTIIIGIVVMVVMKIVFGSGCDRTDIQTSNQNESKMCHYIGSYCQKKFFGACVQKAKRFCCFNSKLARILQEQGRPQLQAFQSINLWGTVKSPECRGFTAEEFQALDFSKIDLSEYFGEIEKDLGDKIQNVQQTITDKVNLKMDTLR